MAIVWPVRKSRPDYSVTGAVGAFERVRDAGVTFPDVEAATRYDGSPVLKAGGVFMAAIATHTSAESDTLVVRAEFETRALLLEDAPEAYYVTDYYEPYPVVTGAAVAHRPRRFARPAGGVVAAIDGEGKKTEKAELKFGPTNDGSGRGERI